MKRPLHLVQLLLAATALTLVAGCGVDDSAGDGEPGVSDADDDVISSDDASDALVGDDYAAPDPIALDGADSAGDEVVPEGSAFAASSGPVAGSHMIVTRYAGLHAHASSTSALLAVAPHGGVADDALHPYRNPRGVVPQGQAATLLDAVVHHGFMKVRVDGVVGFVAKSKLAWRRPGVGDVAFALEPAARNAFFKHQIHRSMWNKDGPLHSGNCAPTSLAMATRIFGKEPAGLSVEESIHRVRATYDGGLHEDSGTNRVEVKNAALALGLHVHTLSTSLSPSAALTRLNGQLALGRVVVLFGQPGAPGAGPTLYEKAFNRAYAAAINAGASLYHAHYDFNGHHAIVVVGKDASGRYVVGDPISEVGFITLTAAEMKDFMTRFTGNRGVGNALWR